MGFSQLLRLREDEQQDLAEAKAELEEQMLDIHKQLDVYHTTAWDHVEQMLQEEQRRAFTDIMQGEGEQILLARERAKLVARLLGRRKDLEDELDRLRSERNQLEE